MDRRPGELWSPAGKYSSYGFAIETSDGTITSYFAVSTGVGVAIDAKIDVGDRVRIKNSINRSDYINSASSVDLVRKSSKTSDSGN